MNVDSTRWAICGDLLGAPILEDRMLPSYKDALTAVRGWLTSRPSLQATKLSFGIQLEDLFRQLEISSLGSAD